MPALSSFAIGALVAGKGMDIYGNIKANYEQAEAEKANATFLREQAEFARQATVRELDIFKDETEQFAGSQVTQAGRGGVDFSGSALLAVANTRLTEAKQRAAITEDGRMKVREAALKAGASEANADRLTSFWNNALPAAGGLLQTAASIGLRKS